MIAWLRWLWFRLQVRPLSARACDREMQELGLGTCQHREDHLFR